MVCGQGWGYVLCSNFASFVFGVHCMGMVWPDGGVHGGGPTFKDVGLFGALHGWGA